MKKKKVLLTGGSGFIGRNILERLGGKYEMSAPGHSELELTDSEAVMSYFKKNDFDTVIHAANIGGTRKTAGRSGIVGTNLRCFFNIARCSGSYGRLIQLGSGAEYDKSGPIKKAKEGEFGIRIPKDDYGFYKYVCSKHIEKAELEDIVCLRIFGCYGKYEDSEQRFISNAICKALLGLPITIENRNVRFSYLHVNDLAGIIDSFMMKKPAHRFYNVAPDDSADLVSIAKKIIGISGKTLKVIVRNGGLGPEYTADNSRLRGELPGFRFTGLDDGIKELYGWYSSSRGSFDSSN